VTGGSRWVALLQEYLAGLGLTNWLASVRTVDTTGSQILADPQGSLETLARSCRLAADQDGATSVILGGAGLVGLAGRIADRVPVPVMDCLQPAVFAARAFGPSSLRDGSLQGTRPGNVALVGINPELTELLSEDFAKGM
jgi:Asp/Glu/hydantoin racemase